MKKLTKILVTALAAVTVLALGIVLSACGGGVKTYTKTYSVNEANPVPSSPLSNVAAGVSAGAKDGYYGSFGNFVDSVSVEATLVIDGDGYTFTWQVHCGTSACATGTYDPVFVWTGDVTASDKTSVTLGAAKTAKVTINATKQFATNAEQTGYFGVVGYEATHETTDCPYNCVPSGSTLLNMFSAGTFALDGATLGNYTVA